ncbi:glucose-6-phosphate dehydrogenase (coenzyme-F420) [Microbacterium sp. BR1]|uniref:glucose-6-phosphate dehydrogenase (coenzyme-F420) n=1 Tax=Microbacterium sp. BR1 TaxID=1070896 RepID=UPI000C2C3BED|nr:glucose-6-phosphate dehydrogenase (coenzyme-F420) [Microbacterium sp. BR1]
MNAETSPRNEHESPETPFRFGYKASSEQFAPSQLLEYAVLAEQMGFDSVFISDHFQPWMHEGGHAPAALPWLGALGSRTDRLVFGTSVLTPTLRYHPGVVAQAFGTLGVLYPGRVILGVGTGEALNEVTLGLDWPAGPERFHRMKEAITVIRRLWAEDRVTFDGDFYSLRDATVYDRPVEPVPVYIGASGPAATRLAGRIADGYITTSGKPEELYTDTLLPALVEGLERGGRLASAIDTLIEVKVSLHPDRRTALERTRFWGPLSLTAEEKMGIHDPIEMQRRANALPLERAASRFIVSTDVEEHVAAIARYLDLGFRHLVFHDPGADQDRFLRTYGEEVLPRLRKLERERSAF